jgi:glyoxylase-like metal-dependent hydrolase (beta-lactamase superfamily II)
MYTIFQSKHFTLEKVKDGIYAAIAKDGGGAVGNAGFVDLGDKTIIFDTFNTPQAALDLKKAAETITDKTETWVINSHYHGDHMRGNQVFTTSHILSSEITFNKMKEIHPARIEKQQNDLSGLQSYIFGLEQQFEQTKDEKVGNQISFLKEFALSLPELKLTLPQHTFNESFTFHGSERSAKLYTFGSGHSFCDSFLYLPEDHVIFMGDLFFNGTHPSFFEESNLENWIRTLDELESWKIDLAIPGHGNVGTKSDMLLIREYIRDVQQLSQNVDDVDQVPIPIPYQGWTYPETFVNNIKRLKEAVKI